MASAFWSSRHVALEISGRTEVGVVTAPALGRQWWAVRSGGAFETSRPRRGAGTRLTVRRTATMHTAVLDGYDDASRARLPREATIAPPSPLALVGLVRGEIDGFLVECCHIWDHAPWILLVEEAGGRFADRAGGHAGDAMGRPLLKRRTARSTAHRDRIPKPVRNRSPSAVPPMWFSRA